MPELPAIVPWVPFSVPDAVTSIQRLPGKRWLLVRTAYAMYRLSWREGRQPRLRKMGPRSL